MERYAAAKAKLFKKNPRIVVLNRDDEWYHYYEQFTGRESTLTYGVDVDADCRIMQAKLGPNSSNLKLKLERAEINPKIHLVGKFNAYNALAAATVAHGLDIEPKLIEEGLNNLKSVSGRMESFISKQGFKVVIDYAHTADALENVLSSLRGITKKRIITVFGATGDRDKSKRPIMGKVVARLSDVAIVTDDDPYTENPIAIRAEVLQGTQDVVDGADVIELPDRRGAIAHAIEIAKKGDIILLAGIGHQKYRMIAGEKVEWSERDIAEELIAKV
jgi:UDP-N-acetylmuramoyl-L-alanyl-D-glutamate--2,6-diaminopimelate ligase